MTTTAKIVGGFVGVIILAAILVLVGIGFGWFSGEANLRSFDHVKATYREAFDDVNSMDANARQACTFTQAVKDATAAGDTSTATQRQTQLLAVENNYDRIKGEYEAYMNDHFRGNVIRPKQLPLPYPTIQERMAVLC